jgi:hypothetical protein
MASTVRIGDLTVNRLGFGAMRVCGTNIWGPPKRRIVPPRTPSAGSGDGPEIAEGESNTLKRMQAQRS